MTGVRESVARGAMERKPLNQRAEPEKTSTFPAIELSHLLTFNTLNWRFLVTPPRWYKGFTLMARTFQVRGSGQWTLDVTIGRRGSLRTFSGVETYPNERDATIACWRMGCRIIDRNPPDCRVSDLSAD